MHQTTVRFAPELWEALEREAREAGVSVAQYVRDAALAQLMYTAGRRGDRERDAALAAILGPLAAVEFKTRGAARVLRRELDSSDAVWSQGALARRRSTELRQQAQRLRLEHARTRVEADALAERRTPPIELQERSRQTSARPPQSGA